MSFFADNNKITITNPDGSTRFSTDRKMPAIVDVRSGSITLPSRSAGSSGTVFHNLGTTTSFADFITSNSRLSGVGQYPWSDVNISSSGSLITNIGWRDIGSLTWRFAGFRCINFELSNGTVLLREDYWNGFPTISLQSFTINYILYIGRFA